jgi:hypothetical protein
MRLMATIGRANETFTALRRASSAPMDFFSLDASILFSLFVQAGSG